MPRKGIQVIDIISLHTLYNITHIKLLLISFFSIALSTNTRPLDSLRVFPFPPYVYI